MRFLIFFALMLFGLNSLAITDTCDACGKKPVGSWYANYQLSLTPFFSSDDSVTNHLRLDIDFHQNSNAINTTFAGAFLQKKEISASMKQRVLNFAGDRIAYEDELRTGLSYGRLLKKSGITLWVSYYHRNLRFLSCPTDAFKLVFGGNKQFEDKTINLSDIRFNNLMYNQYSVGISKQIGAFQLGVNLSFLQGFQHQQLTTNKTSLYTAPQGEYLDVVYNFKFRQSNEGASHFFQPNGLGGSADIHLAYKTAKSQWSFDITDLGVISWNRNPISYQGDSAIRFQGVVIDDITKIGSLKLDSFLKDFIPKKTTASYTTLLPFTVQAVYSKPVALKKGNILVVNIGVNARNLYKYNALAFVKLNFLLNQQWSISTSASYGGYSNFALGFEVGKKSKWIDAVLGTSNLIGSLVPMYYPGSSVYFRVAGKF